MKIKSMLPVMLVSLSYGSFTHADTIDYNIPITVPSWDCNIFAGDFEWYQTWDTLNSGVAIWGGSNYSGSSDSMSLYYVNGSSGYYYQILDATVQNTYQAFSLTWHAASLQNPGLQQEMILFYTDKDTSFNGTVGTGVDTDITNNILLSFTGSLLQFNPEDASDPNGWGGYSLEGLVNGALIEGKHLGIAMRAIFPDGSAPNVYFDSFILNAGVAIPEPSTYGLIFMAATIGLSTIKRRKR